jgi:catalase
MASKTSNRKRKAVRLGDQSVVRGEGGEIHQNAGGDVPQLTTQQGIPASDDQNTLKVGSRVNSSLPIIFYSLRNKYLAVRSKVIGIPVLTKP